MPSSKLIIRRDAAKKPTICISTPPAWPTFPWLTTTYLEFDWQNPGDWPYSIVEEVTFTNPPKTTYTWYWANPSSAEPRIKDCLITIPPDGSQAHARMIAIDELSSLRLVETDFPNPGPRPAGFAIFHWNIMTDHADLAAILDPA